MVLAEEKAIPFRRAVVHHAQLGEERDLDPLGPQLLGRQPAGELGRPDAREDGAVATRTDQLDDLSCRHHHRELAQAVREAFRRDLAITGLSSPVLVQEELASPLLAQGDQVGLLVLRSLHPPVIPGLMGLLCATRISQVHQELGVVEVTSETHLRKSR